MIAEAEQANTSCVVEVTPHEVDAGRRLSFAVTARCGAEFELPEARVTIFDENGVERATAALTETEAGSYAAQPLMLDAPRTVGEYRWRAVVTSADDGETVEEATADVAFMVRAHAARMNVWDLPAAIAAGERFSFKVGVKCSADCDHAGREVTLLDDKGKVVATKPLGTELWPGTRGLHYVELGGKAPRRTGDHRWEVRIAGTEDGLPHATGSVAVKFKVMPAADHEVTVAAIDRQTQTPIRNASVVMHPYRARTDEAGLARIRAAKGDYTILVSASKYIPVQTSVTLADDVVTRAELSLEPPPPSAEDLY